MARKGKDSGPEIVPPIGGLVALAIAACAGDSAVVDNLLIMASRFDTLQCSELVGEFQLASQRIYELTMLPAKAGAVASALAYDFEYAKTKATKNIPKPRRTAGLRPEQKGTCQRPAPPGGFNRVTPAR